MFLKGVASALREVQTARRDVYRAPRDAYRALQGGHRVLKYAYKNLWGVNMFSGVSTLPLGMSGGPLGAPLRLLKMSRRFLKCVYSALGNV